MSLRDFLAVVEIRTKAVSFSALLLGTLYAWYDIGSLRPLVLILVVLAALSVDMGTTAFNSFFDYARGVDNRLFNREGDKVLVHGGVAPGHALLISGALFAVAAGLGIALAVLVHPVLILVGVVSMAVGFLYNAGPLPISRTPVGEVFAGGFLGTVLMLIAYSVHGRAPDTGVFFVSLPSWLFVASILTTNNTCDIEGDRAAGRRTLSVLLGRRAGAAIIVGLAAAAYAVMAILGAGSVLPWPVWPAAAVGAAASVPVYRGMLRRGFSHETKGLSMRSILRAFLIYTVVYAAAIVVGGLLPA